MLTARPFGLYQIVGEQGLFGSLVDAGIIDLPAPTTAQVLVTTLDQDNMSTYLAMAAALRGAGINTELYSEPHKFAKQMRYANKKGFKYVVIAGEEEFSAQRVTVRELSTGEQLDIPMDGLVRYLLDTQAP